MSRRTAVLSGLELKENGWGPEGLITRARHWNHTRFCRSGAMVEHHDFEREGLVRTLIGWCVLATLLSVSCKKQEAAPQPAAAPPRAAVAPPAPAPPPVASDEYAATYEEAKTLIDNWNGEGKKLEEARARLMSILEKNRDYAPAFVGLARVEANAGYYSGSNYDPEALSRARKFVQHALKLDPNLLDAHYTAAFIARVQGDLDLAKQSLDQIESLGGSGTRLKLARADVAYLERRSDEVVRLGREVVAESNDGLEKARAYFLLSGVYTALGHLDAADEAYRRQIELQPESAWAHGNYARFLLKRDDADGAIREAERAAQILPYGLAVSTLADAYQTKANMLWNEKRYADSAAYVEKLVVLAGDDANTWYAAGVLLERAAGRVNDAALRVRAMKAYRRALELDPQLEPARKALARLEQSQ